MHAQILLEVFEDRSDPDRLATEEKYQSKPNCTLLTFQRQARVLKDAGPEATLLISGYTEAGSARIHSQPSGGEELSAYDLAQRLETAGLSNEHRKIRLLASWAGKEAGERPGFASRLASELGALGYSHIAVGGYLWDVNTTVFGNTRFRIEGDELSREDMGDAGKQRIAWYGASGAEVSKPQVPPLRPMEFRR
jgi:hypothetical protein